MICKRGALYIQQKYNNMGGMQRMKKLILKGMGRRKKELWYVFIVTFIATLFLSGITLYQKIMDDYMYRINGDAYGEWIVSSVDEKLKHPYFSVESGCTTGINLVDDEGERLNIYAGKVDNEFSLLDGESIYDGRMPENDNEIAMDIVSLALLGYHYDLGQNIKVNYKDVDGIMHSKQYVLVGTLKSISEIWNTNSSYPIPNFFVSDSEFALYEEGSYTTYFYKLDDKYKEMASVELATSFMDDEKIVTYNEYVYENRFWDSVEMYEQIEVVLTVISILAISYLLIAYTEKRRGVYYKYRCIGASKSQVRWIIFAECVYATLPAVITGMILSHIGAYAICSIMSKKKGIKNFYELDIVSTLIQVITILVVILIGIIVAQFSCREKRLAGNTGEVKPSKYKRIRRLALRTKKPENTIFKRQIMIKPIQNILFKMFSIVVCGVMVFCVYKITESYNGAKNRLKNCDDFIMQHSTYFVENYVNEQGFEIEQKWKAWSMYEGANENLYEEIYRCPGVEKISKKIINDAHYFNWEDADKSPILKITKEESWYRNELSYGMRMNLYENISDIKSLVSEWKNNEDINWDAIEKGEEIIFVVNNRFVNLEDESTIDVVEDTLEVGKEVEIINFFTGEKTLVKVGFIYLASDLGSPYSVDSNSFKLIGSSSLAERIAENEGEDFKYNDIKIEYNQNASYQSTDKQLALISERYDMEFYSDSEEIRIIKRELINDIAAYGAVFVLIMVVYIAVNRNIIFSKNKYWRSRFVTLKQIGMEDRQYFIKVFVGQCKTYLVMFVGIVLGYGLIANEVHTEYIKEKMMLAPNSEYTIYWTLSNKYINSEKEYIFYYIKDMINHKLNLIVIIGIYVVLLVSAAMTIKKCIKGDK